MYVFENLNLYNTSIAFAVTLENAADGFPPSIDYFADRLKQAARTIPAQIAEAHGHWKEEERREFFWKAREATQECAGLIEIAVRQNLINEKFRINVRLKLDTLQKMVQEALRSTEKKSEAVSAVAGPFDLKIL